MADLIKLFDSLLVVVVSFPFTIFNTLFFPDKVVGPAASDLTSPPGVTLLASFVIWYFAHATGVNIRLRSYEPADKASDEPPNQIPAALSKDFAMILGVLMAVGLVVQYLILLIPSLLPAPPADPVTAVKALSYPVSVSMTIYAVIYLAYLLFPIGSHTHGLSFTERFSPSFRKAVVITGGKRIVIEENAGCIALWLAILAYALALFNVVRVIFGLAAGQAIVPTISLLVGSLVLLILFGSVVPGRYEKLFDKLKSKLQPMPAQEEKKENPSDA